MQSTLHQDDSHARDRQRKSIENDTKNAQHDASTSTTMFSQGPQLQAEGEHITSDCRLLQYHDVRPQ